MSNRIRIAFSKGGKVIKTFDRKAENKQEAEDLAREIAADAKIDHDAKTVEFERKVHIEILDDTGKQLEFLESKALDEDDAKKVAESWAARAGKKFAAVKIRFIQ
ncbi:MAG: hypothetical protein JW730_18245 [Anaerolineales bacterium]|nr:hypothetical protein [Anaerolineales bacterium]